VPKSDSEQEVSESYTRSQRKKTGRRELRKNHATRRGRIRPGKNTPRKYS